eukprot:580137-Hanusia_phi.AAC.1
MQAALPRLEAAVGAEGAGGAGVDAGPVVEGRLQARAHVAGPLGTVVGLAVGAGIACRAVLLEVRVADAAALADGARRRPRVWLARHAPARPRGVLVRVGGAVLAAPRHLVAPGLAHAGRRRV